jgi:hypothetical protein
MTEFLHRLAGRTIGIASVAKPIVPAMFTPDFHAEGSAARAGAVAESSVTASIERIPTDSLSSLTLPKTSDEPLFKSLSERNPEPHESHFSRDRWPEAPGEEELNGPTVTKQAMIFAQTNDRVDTHGHVEVPDSLPERMRAEDVSAITDERERKIPALQIRPASQANPRSLQTERARYGNDEPQSPVIRVTIGRIDVRAQFPAASSSTSPAQPRKTAALSLDEYMKQRSEGKR